MPETRGWTASTDFDELRDAIHEFELRLPGWWYSLGTCNVSRDASCGPDSRGADADLLEIKLFDEGFHCDDREGSMADALRSVMQQALDARAQVRGSAPPPLRG